MTNVPLYHLDIPSTNLEIFSCILQIFQDSIRSKGNAREVQRQNGVTNRIQVVQQSTHTLIITSLKRTQGEDKAVIPDLHKPRYCRENTHSGPCGLATEWGEFTYHKHRNKSENLFQCVSGDGPLRLPGGTMSYT